MAAKKDVCPYCAAEREFGGWYWAHCMEILYATCAKCDKKYSSCNGINTEMPQTGKKK